jgi:ubiquinone/menaquinone biosynthesis C-methylase UbiE
VSEPRTGERAHHHPVFARFYSALAHAAERTTFAKLRRRTLSSAHGRLLIVGAGQGHDLAHLPGSVTQVVAVEPDPAMRRLGQHRVAAAGVPAAYVGAVAERLPLADDSVDTVLCTLVLCSVHDLAAAAAEFRRVLRPGGRLLVLEHVRAPDGTRVAALQDRLDGVWGHVSGGCHLNRRTREALEGAGFDTSGVRDRHITKAVPLIDPGLEGVAVPQR